MPEFNSHLDIFELLNLIRCGRNSAYETGLTVERAFIKGCTAFTVFAEVNIKERFSAC